MAFSDHAEAVIVRIRRALAIRLDDLGIGGQWVDWLAVTPPSSARSSPTVIGLYGRTSSGKTTLARRLVNELSPDYSKVAAALGTDVRAHTTRIPIIFDFKSSGRHATWHASGPGGKTGGQLGGSEGSSPGFQKLKELLAGGQSARHAWVRIALPSRLRRGLRVIDLPGTRGFEKGPWSKTADLFMMGLDAIVLPMDRRFFRNEEFLDLNASMVLEPRRPVAIALRWVRADVAQMSPQDFIDRRVLQAMSRDIPEGKDGSHELLSLRRDLRRLAVFMVAKEAGAPDSFSEFVRWIKGVTQIPQGPPRYSQLERLAAFEGKVPWSIIPRDEALLRARVALTLLGVLRAWMTCLTLG